MSDVPTEIKDDEKELDIDPENVKRNETSLNIDCFAERESIGIIKPFACTMCSRIPRKTFTSNDKIVCEGCEGDDKLYSKLIDSMIKQRSIECPNVFEIRRMINNNNWRANCEWRGKISEYTNHENSCQYGLTKCEFCDKYVVKCEYDKHVSLCPEAIVECPLKCGKEMRRKEVQNHILNECEMEPLPCPNNGCDKKILRKDYDNHVNHECEFRIVDCEYKKYGCKCRLVYKDIAVHMNEYETKHMQMKMEYNQSILKDEISDLVSVVSTLKKDLNDTRKELISSKDEADVLKNTLNSLETNFDDNKQKSSEQIDEIKQSLLNDCNDAVKDLTKQVETLANENIELKGKVNILSTKPKIRVNKYDFKNREVTVDIKYVNKNINKELYGPYTIDVYYAKLTDNEADIGFGFDDKKIEWQKNTYAFNENKFIQRCKIKNFAVANKHFVKCQVSNKFGKSIFSDIKITTVFAWSNRILHNYNVCNLNDWNRGYFATYDDITRSQFLKNVCPNTDDIIICVGAIKKSDPNNLVICAFGPASILHNYTNSQVQAFIPERFKNTKYSVYWYHYKNKSFGFSHFPEVNLNSADTRDDQYRLSWHLQGLGGYRCGSIKDLNADKEYHKVIYWRKVGKNRLIKRLK